MEDLKMFGIMALVPQMQIEELVQMCETGLSELTAESVVAYRPVSAARA